MPTPTKSAAKKAPAKKPAAKKAAPVKKAPAKAAAKKAPPAKRPTIAEARAARADRNEARKAAPAAEFARVPLADLYPREENIRREAKISADEMVPSIMAFGVLTPLNVVPRPAAGFWINDGERRYWAARSAGLVDVPCMVDRSIDDPTSVTFAMLIANLQREDISPVEEAHGYLELRDTAGLKIVDIAARVGVSEKRVASRLLLTLLPDDLQLQVHERLLPLERAEELPRLRDFGGHDVMRQAAREKWDGFRVRQHIKEVGEREIKAELVAQAKAAGCPIIGGSQIGKLMPAQTTWMYELYRPDKDKASLVTMDGPLDYAAVNADKNCVGVTLRQIDKPGVAFDARPWAMVAVGRKRAPKAAADRARTELERQERIADGGHDLETAEERTIRRDLAEEQRVARLDHWEAFMNAPMPKATVKPMEAAEWLQRLQLMQCDAPSWVLDKLGITRSGDVNSADQLRAVFDDAPTQERIRIAFIATLWNAEQTFYNALDDDGAPAGVIARIAASLGFAPLELQDLDEIVAGQLEENRAS